jgi:sodium/proline symporter
MTLATFVLYLLILVGTGVFAYFRSRSYADYALAGRSMNRWVTAISAEASDMSSWLLMGLPGMAFVTGMGSVWVIIGILFGTLFNWTVIAERLRRITAHFGSLTLTSYLEERLGDRSGLLRYSSGIAVIVFFMINVAAEIVGSGKLFNAAFGYDYNVGIWVGAIVVLIYTFLGGFMAVAWTNLIQGIMMVVTLLLVPIGVLGALGGWGHMLTKLGATDINLLHHFAGNQGFLPIFGLIVGGVAIGIGYPGQPHILANFMAAKDAKEIRMSTLIAMVWVALSMYGAVIIGMAARAFFGMVEDPETVIIMLSERLYPSAIVGFVSAAVVAAILSSVGAYLIVASAAAAENIYQSAVKRHVSDRELILVNRIALVLITLGAVIMAQSGGLVFELALYAWGGLAASFGPPVILSLYWKRLNRQGAFAGIVVGLLTIIIWYNTGLSDYLYELVPGFFLSLLATWLVSEMTGGPTPEEIKGYNEYLDTLPKKGPA